MSKSAGQWIGTAVGAVAGFFLPGGYVALGASIGGMVGGMIDPPKGPSVTGPRLEDQGFTSSTLGAALARGYGTFPVSGNVIWLEGDKYREVTTTESQGGKGGGGSEVTSYTYYATFAVSLLRATDPTQTVSLRRLWVGSNLVFDAGSDNLQSILASNTGDGVNFTFYSGTDTQQPNPRWQSDKGVNAVSGFPGRCYIVIEDLDLTKYGNSLAMAQIKAELVVSAVPTVQHYAEFTAPGVGTYENIVSAVVEAGLVDYVVARRQDIDSALLGVDFYRGRLGEGKPALVFSNSHSIAASYGRTGVGSVYVSHNRDGVARYIGYQGLYFTYESILTFISGASVLTSPTYASSDYHYGYGNIAACDGNESFIGDSLSSVPIYRFSSEYVAGHSSYSVRAAALALSENRLFALHYTGGYTSSTVTVFDRETLTVIDTYTQSVNGFSGVFDVVSDNEFYLASGDDLSHWVNGTAENLGSVCHQPTGSWPNRWVRISIDPDYFIQFEGISGDYVCGVVVSNERIPSTAASLRDIITAECGLAGVGSAEIDLAGLIDHDVRGYRITERGSVRAALEPLQARFPFDVAHSGYKLRFVSRGGVSLETIPESDLGTVADSEKGAVLLTVAREMDTQLPRKVSVKYLDVDREYDLGEQYSERPAPNSVNERVVELPLVMNSSEGAQTADVLLSKEWVERTDFGPFTLPPTWRALEAADVVTIEHRGQAHTVRLTRVEYLPDGRITCNAKLTSAQSYTSTATGEAPAILGQSLVPLRGVTTGLLLDIPMVLSQQDKPGIAAAVYGVASGWPGASILRSDDYGNSYQGVFSSTVSPSVFRATIALGAGRTDIIDAANVLTLTEVSRAPTLASVSFASAAAGQNLAALGADGRWEIISFLTVTDNGNDTWTIRDFMRGRFGTEWAMSLHQADDLLVILSPSSVGFIGLPISALNSTSLYRAVTLGSLLDSAADVSHTYAGSNLKPLAPARIKGNVHPTTFDFTATWDRVSRTPVEPFSGIPTPLGESAELYEAEFWDSGFVTKKRTVTGLTSASVTYLKNDQIADFGLRQSVFNIKVFPVSSTVWRGYPAQAVISHVVLNDPYVDLVKCLIHGNDTGLTDVMGHPVTLNGNAQRVADAAAFGGYCASLDGTGDWLYLDSVDFAPGAGDFTIEVRCNPVSVTNSGLFQLSATSGGFETANRGLVLNFNSGGGGLGVSYGGTNTFITQTVTTETFHHFSMCRSGTTLRVFYDGNLVGTYTDSTNYSGNRYLVIGGYYSSTYVTNGKFEEFRLTKYARYTAAFTPPTSQFPDD